MLTIQLPPNVDEARARLLLAIALFQEEDVSVGRAAEIAGLSYRAFVDALTERGIPPYPADEDPETIAAELQTVRKLMQELDRPS